MTQRVDFYILKKKRIEAYAYLARLVEKIYSLEKSVLIFTNSEDESNILDNLLWSYQDCSFLPHEILNQLEPLISPIVISSNDMIKRDVLINLQTQLPSFIAEFERVIEIVYEEDDIPQLSRQKYRQYQNSGCQIHTFRID